ncbi:MAG TPA: hypothetical protein VLB73_03995 [Patescibacteria group bacterium]|nr:hypothetical protein [Patescibacteria group bacterium]
MATMSAQRENLKKIPVLVSGVPSGDQPGNIPSPTWRTWRRIVEKNPQSGPDKGERKPYERDITVPPRHEPEIVQIPTRFRISA